MKKLKLLFTLLLINPLIGQVQLGNVIYGDTAGELAGGRVAISSDGQIVAVTSTEADSGAGHVRVFKITAGNWVQLGTTIVGDSTNVQAGTGLALSDDGTIIAVGAHYSFGPAGNQIVIGQVKIYQFVNNDWYQLGSDIYGEAIADIAGYSVALSSDGSRIAIGAPQNDGNGTTSGHVRVYEYSAGSWTQLGADIDGEAASNASGWSISLSSDGSTVAIGAPWNDDNGAGAGHVRIYEYSAGSWTQLGSDIDGEAEGDNSGFSVSLSADGATVAIGAYRNISTDTSGHVRVYHYSSGNWSQLGSDINGEDNYERFGWSVAISGDGTKVVVGVPWNKPTATSQGQVRIFEYSSGSWIQIGYDIDAISNEVFGFNVATDSDGSTIVVGAPWNNDSDSAAGAAKVYTISSINVTTNAESQAVALYPNPTKSYLNLDIPEEMIGQQYSFVITNAAGQAIHSNFLNQAQLQINLKNFASSGIHTLQIKDSGGNVLDTRVIILQ